ncbi:MAG: BamA/TamA family outer membrane protein [Deltaproteobacteria bacterium]|nr:BamA/TamA family outer membrane protein [Deltaproteobacteria bacterium]
MQTDKRLFYVFLLVILGFSINVDASELAVCGNYKIQTKKTVRFTTEEKKLICGDKSTNSWKSIPVTEAQYFIKVFLQGRGYYFPVFEMTGSSVLVKTGELTLIKDIKVTGDSPSTFKINKLRKIKKKPLSPKRLDEIMTWASQTLKSSGYACPRISVSADAHLGEVELDLQPGIAQTITSIKEDKIKNLDEKILRRYDAFETGKLYNEKLLNLTSDRVEKSGILENNYFVSECKPDGVHLNQKTFAGRPRLFQAGFGLNTEEYAMVRVSWQHGRIGKSGSKLKTDLYASYLKQQLSADLSFYPFKPTSRFFLNPTFSLKREFYNKDHYLSGDLSLTPAYVFDNQTLQMLILAGPQLIFTQTFEGIASGFSKFVSGYVRMQIRSHEYEHNLRRPQNGFDVLMTSTFSSHSLLSDVTVQKITLDAHKLWNIGNYSPPFLVIGVRGALSTSITDTTSPNVHKLPPNFLFYLGGSQNLRGFNSDELPDGEGQALTSAFTSIEVRLADVLPFRVQPFIFSDAGILGSRSFAFDKTIYFSPGGGVRVDSPVGVFRATMSHGLLLNKVSDSLNHLSHWQFYFAFGEEF